MVAQTMPQYIETSDPSSCKIIEPDYKQLYMWMTAYISSKDISTYVRMIADMRAAGVQVEPVWLIPKEV